MIVLLQENVNTVVFTLDEKHSSEDKANTYYLFRIYDNYTGLEKIFISAELSTNITRYNRVDIELTATEDVALGKIDLQDGSYDYTVYESLLTNQPADTYNLDTTTKIVEEGRVTVKGNEETRATYEEQTPKATYNG